MTIFIIQYRNYLEDVKVTRYVDQASASREMAKVHPDPAVSSFVVNTDSNLAEMSSSMLVTLYNLWRDEGDKEVKKFENRTIARTRFLTRLEVRFGKLPEIEVPAEPAPKPETPAAAPPPGPGTPASAEAKEPEMATKTKKEKKEKKAKANGEGRVIGKPAGLVADFRQVRDGTDRQKVLKLMDGTKTVSQIAKAIDKDEKYVLTAAYCLNRDSAIGYGIEDGKLLATYPGSKTYEDAIKPAASK